MTVRELIYELTNIPDCDLDKEIVLTHECDEYSEVIAGSVRDNKVNLILCM